MWRGVGSVTGYKYGTAEYGKAWRDLHKDRLAADRKLKYSARAYKRRRRYHWLNAYKVAKGCESCGYNKHAVSLDFDHVDPSTKKFTVAHRIDLSTVKTLMAEVRKCQVLCANCHRIKSYEDKLAGKTR